MEQHTYSIGGTGHTTLNHVIRPSSAFKSQAAEFLNTESPDYFWAFVTAISEKGSLLENTDKEQYDLILTTAADSLSKAQLDILKFSLGLRTESPKVHFPFFNPNVCSTLFNVHYWTHHDYLSRLKCIHTWQQTKGLAQRPVKQFLITMASSAVPFPRSQRTVSRQFRMTVTMFIPGPTRTQRQR